MLKVLQILPSLNVCGGVEHYLMNYYTHIDEKEVQFDFAVHSIEDNYFKSKVDERGGKVYLLPPFTVKNMSAIMQGIENIFKNEQYDIVHCHQANGAFFYFKVAKKYGIKCRILHSHQAAAADKWSHKLRNLPLLWLGKKYATDYFACSKLAGDYLFKNKSYQIINNAIDTAQFKFCLQYRREVRKRYGISDDAFVIGNIGRMCFQKNQSFLIELFYEFVKLHSNSYLLLVGGGEEEERLKKCVFDKGLGNKVIFCGTTEETYKYYSAMDTFALPSLYEGLPIVGVEAQCSGLSVFVSDRVTRELKLSHSLQYLPLNDKKAWLEGLEKAYQQREALVNRADCANGVALGGFDIQTESRKLTEIYQRLGKK